MNILNTLSASAKAGFATAGLFLLLPAPCFAQAIEQTKSVRVLPPAQIGIVNPGDKVTINPQPLPPKQVILQNPGDKVSINPQPLPPKQVRVQNPGDKVSINPQPLPPKQVKLLVNPGDTVSVNPPPQPSGNDGSWGQQPQPSGGYDGSWNSPNQQGYYGSGQGGYGNNQYVPRTPVPEIQVPRGALQR